MELESITANTGDVLSVEFIRDYSVAPSGGEPVPGEEVFEVVEVDIAGLMPDKAHCIAAASQIERFDWSKNHTFMIKDTFGVFMPTYLIQYVANGAEDAGSNLYKFYTTMLAEAK